MRISMMRPMPFWPSFEPWKKLTPVQVRISSPRIHQGGGSLPLGASYSALSLMNAFMAISSMPATKKPTMGDSTRDFPMFAACPQSTPLVPVFTDINWLAMPTPIIEPIMVCELEAGRPNHQVPRFQMMAATSSANTMAKPAPLPTCRISSTGNSETMPKATAPEESTTPIKLQNPDQVTAICGSSECV